MPSDLPAVRESRPPRVPTYRRHKPSGQPVVNLDGQDVYLGPWNTKASRAEYDRLIGEWLAAGRTLPRPEADLTIAELALRHWRFAKGYYRKEGRPTGSLDRVKIAMRILRESYAHTLAKDFGPRPFRPFNSHWPAPAGAGATATTWQRRSNGRSSGPSPKSCCPKWFIGRSRRFPG